MTAASNVASYDKTITSAQVEAARADELPRLPPAPTTIEETRLKEGFIVDLVLKTLYSRGVMTGGELAETLKMPYFNIVQKALQFLRSEELAEIRRGQSHFEQQWEFILTSKGLTRAREVMQYNGYVGPAPVALSDYVEYLRSNPVKWTGITAELLREVLKDLVINERMLLKLGPAFNSGKSMFLYGNAGNGKTSIAERLARALRGGYLVPYAMEVEGQVIQYFDAAYHEPIKLSEEESRGKDHRWLVCKRPFIVVGGELRLEHLELSYDHDVKYYIAPAQMKANGGVFMIDDFGRQQVSPRDLLNRWMVPLEKNVDFYTLATGEQLAVPFHVLVIFSTNLAPKDLVEEAFLRRIRYKIEITDPSEEEYRQIFQRVCDNVRIPYDDHMVTYLLQKHYKPNGRGLRASHPRDLMSQLVDYCNYMGIEKRLTPELIDIVCESYFVELT